jgi:hypothetical protein
MQGQAQNLWLNLAIGTNPPTEDLSDWSEDAPWVELTLQLHRTTERVVTIRLDGSQENFYLLADPMDKGRKLTSGLSDWVKSAQHNNRLYKRLLRKNVLPTFTPLEVVELLAYYIEHYPGD